MIPGWTACAPLILALHSASPRRSLWLSVMEVSGGGAFLVRALKRDDLFHIGGPECISPETVMRAWKIAKGWLMRELSRAGRGRHDSDRRVFAPYILDTLRCRLIDAMLICRIQADPLLPVRPHRNHEHDLLINVGRSGTGVSL